MMNSIAEIGFRWRKIRERLRPSIQYSSERLQPPPPLIPPDSTGGMAALVVGERDTAISIKPLKRRLKKLFLVQKDLDTFM